MCINVDFLEVWDLGHSCLCVSQMPLLYQGDRGSRHLWQIFLGEVLNKDCKKGRADVCVRHLFWRIGDQ